MSPQGKQSRPEVQKAPGQPVATSISTEFDGLAVDVEGDPMPTPTSQARADQKEDVQTKEFIQEKLEKEPFIDTSWEIPPIEAEPSLHAKPPSPRPQPANLEPTPVIGPGTPELTPAPVSSDPTFDVDGRTVTLEQLMQTYRQFPTIQKLYMKTLNPQNPEASPIAPTGNMQFGPTPVVPVVPTVPVPVAPVVPAGPSHSAYLESVQKVDPEAHAFLTEMAAQNAELKLQLHNITTTREADSRRNAVEGHVQAYNNNMEEIADSGLYPELKRPEVKQMFEGYLMQTNPNMSLASNRGWLEGAYLQFQRLGLTDALPPAESNGQQTVVAENGVPSRDLSRIWTEKPNNTTAAPSGNRGGQYHLMDNIIAHGKRNH